jgi:GNAT superfamily N-acetyltransferase
MAIEIREVISNHDLKTFIRYPLSLYKGNPYYVPSLFTDEMNILAKDRNPAFADSKARYWLAYRDGKIVGRVAALTVPKHEIKWGDKYMRFGWLDFIDDAEVVQALMGTVESWAKELGMKGIHGPLGFTDLDREGMLIEGFDEVATLATYYNYPYYQKRLEELGYGKDVDWVEYEIKLTDQSQQKIARTAEIVAKRSNLHLFTGSKKELLKLAPQIFAVLEEAYRGLYGTVPLSDAQVKTYIDGYFGLAMTEYIPLVLDENEKVIAFGITFPSFSKALQKTRGNLFPFGFITFLRAMKKNDRADLYLVGVKDEYRGKGVNGMVMNQIYQTFMKNGIKFVESNPNLELNNDVQAMWKYFENRQHKRRRCFVKHLS